MCFRLKVNALLLLCCAPLCANVCTPLSAPANGTHPAVVNGVDALDWGQARIQWTSDAGGTIGTYAVSCTGTCGGYALGDTGTVFGSTTSPAIYTVTGVSSGVVTSVTLGANNGYSVDGSTPGLLHPGYAGGSQPGVGQGLMIAISSVTGAVTATNQRILYATAANWGGTSNPTSYPLAQGVSGLQVNDSNTIQGWPVMNLTQSTVYHALGQSYQGGVWCTASDITFTTPARPAVTPLPILPMTVNTTRPTVTGTSWVYGSNCGDSGTITQRWQNCLSGASPGSGTGMHSGDDLSVPAGVYGNTGILVPTNEHAIAITANISTSTFTQSGSAPSSGTLVILGSPPSPINPGVPYCVFGASGSNFQLSTATLSATSPPAWGCSGGSAITLAAQAAVSPTQYLTYPVALDKTIHPSSSASLLPPTSVRLGPNSLAQYTPNMITLEQLDIGSASLQFAQLAAGWYFTGINFTSDPSVAATSGAQFDPPSFGFVPVGLSTGFGLQQNETVSSVVWNQCAMNPAAAPSRSGSAFFDGSNVAYVNGYANFEFWQPLLVAPTVTTSSTVITIPSFDYYWVGSGGTVGTKEDCHYTGGSLTVTGGTATTTSGANKLWVDASCNMNAQLVSGMTATGTNLTVQATAATPAYPTYNYTTPLGSTVHPYAVLPFSAFDLTSGAITSFSGFGSSGISSFHFESASGFYSGYGPGPKLFDNDYHIGGGIVGVFNAEDSTTGGSPCGSAHACAEIFNQGDFTETRSTVLMNPCFFPDSVCWNGGAYWPRNGTEMKKGYRLVQDGNVFGPLYTGVGSGQCAIHEAFNDGSIPTYGGYPSYTDSSEWTFTNNTCFETGVGISDQIWYYAVIPAMPLKNFLWRNNLFLNGNAYALASTMAPAGYHYMQGNTMSGCPFGYTTQQGTGMNFTFDHNTISGQGGCLSLWDWWLQSLIGGLARTNNIYNVVTDPGTWAGVLYGTNYEQDGGHDAPDCTALFGAALFNCPTVNNYNFNKNVMLATWTNSFPGSQVEYTPSQIATLQTGLGSYAAANYFPNDTTLAQRQGHVGWFSVSAANFRLISSSPYISGAHASTDGQDIGANMDQLEQHQGKVSNVRVLSRTSTSATVAFYAPDSFACGVDYGTTAFYNGSGSWTRVAGAAGSPDPRVQSVALTGLTAHSLVYVEINCAVMQPTLTVQLP